MNLSKIKLGDRLKFRAPYTSPHDQDFGVISKASYWGSGYPRGTRVQDWFYCREEFRHYWNLRIQQKTLESKFIFFQMKDWRQVYKFISALERKLKITYKSICGPAISPGGSGTWIRVSSWWTKSPLRRDFFTMALRSIRYHKKSGSVKDAILRSEYGQDTSKAVSRFLDGYTFGRLTYHGWVDTFYDSSERHLSLRK